MLFNNFIGEFKSTLNQVCGSIITVGIILLSPFYFYASGLPQPPHILIFLASLTFLLINKIIIFNFFKSYKSGVFFLCLVLIINFYYFMTFNNLSFVINSFYWLFNYILFIAVVALIEKKSIYFRVSSLIAFKFTLIIFAYLFGLGGYSFWPRYEYFFNGPNQLAYFSICLFLVYIALMGLRVNFIFLLVYSMLVLIVISSGGRSAYFALIPIVVILVWGLKRRISSVIVIMAIPLVVNMGFNFFKLPNFSVKQKIAAEIKKFDGAEIQAEYLKSNKGSSLVGNVADETKGRILNLTLDDNAQQDSILLQLSARGYLRALEHPVYLLFGAGQGYDERFIDRYGYVYEIHSSFFAILFYYGIFGLIFFLYFIWQIFKIKLNILFLSPLIIYGLFTYGLRSPYFWFALAFLSAAPDLFKLSDDDLRN